MFKKSLTPFKISRIHTDLGIFKVNGYRSSPITDKISIIFTAVFILSTDGWEELTLTQANNELLKQLRPYLEHHLRSNL